MHLNLMREQLPSSKMSPVSTSTELSGFVPKGVRMSLAEEKNVYKK
jgi:hypothetical protein